MRGLRQMLERRAKGEELTKRIPAEVTFLVVEVVRASELRKADSIGSSDPLLSIFLSSDTKKALYTTPKCISYVS